jgi:hypothetical protein
MAHHIERFARVALGALLADADDSSQACSPCRLGFRADQRIGLMMVSAPLRVTQDDRAGTGISQHPLAETSPVCAPDASAHDNPAPTITVEP